MYCHDCGHKLKEGARYCEHCGTQVKEASIPKVKDSARKLTREALKGKVWFRILKVFYIFSLVACLLLFAVISYTGLPQKTLDPALSEITCNNGTSYSLANSYIYVYGSTLSLDNIQDAEILCEYDTTSYYLHQYDSLAQNYIFTPAYEPQDYSSWFFGSLIALVIIGVLFAVIRRVFLYIALG